MRSIVRWYGGKHYLAKWIVEHFPRHEVYVEPYGGGASVLLAKKPSPVEIYNDLDKRIVRLFRVIRENPKRFVSQAKLVLYHELEFNSMSRKTREERALADFAMWRMSFAGRGEAFCFTTARSRRGMADCVSGYLSSIELLPEIIDRLRRVQFFCRDALNVIEKFTGNKKALIYLDPPYVKSARSSGIDAYKYDMTDLQHEELAEAVTATNCYVVISGYDCRLYRELYKGWRTVTKAYNNNAGGGGVKKKEVLWLNF